jgi:hypothetical protein
MDRASGSGASFATALASASSAAPKSRDASDNSAMAARRPARAGSALSQRWRKREALAGEFIGRIQTSLYVPGGVLWGKIARHAALGQRDGKVDAAIVASASLIGSFLLTNNFRRAFTY